MAMKTLPRSRYQIRKPGMKLRAAIVGATGAVGQTVLDLLAEREFPCDSLTLLATKKSAGESLAFRGEPLAVTEVSQESFVGVDLVFFCASAGAAERWVPVAIESGSVVVDNSRAFRMEVGVPLVVPEVNGSEVADGPDLIANPNCSTIQLVLTLAPLTRLARIERVVVSTYQSVSGSGGEALLELEGQLAAGGGETVPIVYPHPIGYNCFPQVDVFDDNGLSGEELKLIQESRKILGLADLALTATTVRIPVRIGHSEAVNITFDRPVTAEQARQALREAPGVAVMDEPSRGLYPTPLAATGRDEALVGRIRRDPSQANGIDLWISCDNLRKGAALNAIQIAEQHPRFTSTGAPRP
jgi:aspartate-semialdehyde dehydrogenase